MKYTLNGIGESKYVKIVINHFKNDLPILKQISTNRGTSIETLLAFYDINNNNKKKPTLQIVQIFRNIIKYFKYIKN